MAGYFFCGIGGSGMLPLALILKGQGAEVLGSDRSRDQARTPEKFEWLEKQGLSLFAQDGSGIRDDLQALVVSTAVEETIPDVRAARAAGVPIIKRAELLARLFNAAETRVSVAGTSGKSTTTGMIGYVLKESGLNPTVMNGAVFRNFVSDEMPYATALCGRPDLFITEADESDGSIALYHPTIAVLNNVALDHKSMDELVDLFKAYLAVADASVLNLDNAAVADLAIGRADTAVTYGLEYPGARFTARDIAPTPSGLRAVVVDQQSGETCELSLQVPGRHNLSNALACIATCRLLGLSLDEICSRLSGFLGVKRRMEVIGSAGGVIVIDDFAHNPDKIAATLSTLRESPGRLHIVFQVHGYNPIRLMHKEYSEVFAKHLEQGDRLYIPEVLYLGGTVDKSVTAKDLVREIKDLGVQAEWVPDRDAAASAILGDVKQGDRVIVMGARDDTLSDFARGILSRMSQR